MGEDFEIFDGPRATDVETNPSDHVPFKLVARCQQDAVGVVSLCRGCGREGQTRPLAEELVLFSKGDMQSVDSLDLGIRHGCGNGFTSTLLH